MKQREITLISIITLILLGVITHQEWFNFKSILTFADWHYQPIQATAQLMNSYGTWINFFNVGSPNIQIYFYSFSTIWSILAKMGLSFDFGVKLTLLIPIAILGFLSPFYLIKKITNNNKASVISAIFYGSTTYFIIYQTAHIFFAFEYAILPIIFYLFIDAIEKKKLKNWLLFTIILFLISTYEVRMTVVILSILFIYLCVSNEIKKNFKQLLIMTLIFILLSSFWILPTIQSKSIKQDITQIANRGLFGNSFFSITQSLTLHDYGWTGDEPNIFFKKQPIQSYLWIIPIITVMFLLFKRKDEKYKLYLFFVIISIIGIFLTKQSGEPFSQAYKLLYLHFPGFNLFREASKFEIITAFGYLGIMGLTLNIAYKKHRKRFFYILCILILIPSIYNLKPLVTKDIGSMFVNRIIPGNYQAYNKYILTQNHSFFRTMWIPTYHRFGIYTNTIPIVSAARMDSSNWKNLLLSNSSIKKLNYNKQIPEILLQNYSKRLISLTSIKYIIIPPKSKENSTDIFIWYGNNRTFFVNKIKNVSYLKQINIGTGNLLVFENPDYLPHIYLTKEKESIYQNIPYKNTTYKIINPTEYKITLKNLSKTTNLNFGDSYDSSWKLRLGKFNWFNSIISKNYSYPDQYHYKNEATLNSWTIDPNYIKQNYPKSDYTVNPDESINIEMTLYFKPQSYFYLGLIISLTTFTLCILYFIYDWRRNKKDRWATKIHKKLMKIKIIKWLTS